MLGQPEDPGTGVARLRLRRDGAQFDVAEPQGRQAPPALAVLVVPRGQTDPVGEGQSEGLDRLDVAGPVPGGQG